MQSVINKELHLIFGQFGVNSPPKHANTSTNFISIIYFIVHYIKLKRLTDPAGTVAEWVLLILESVSMREHTGCPKKSNRVSN